MYKITCNNVSFLKSNSYKGADFKGVAFVDDEETANEFKNCSLQFSGTPLFEVEEVEKEV